jgi:hypothetical protein
MRLLLDGRFEAEVMLVSMPELDQQFDRSFSFQSLRACLRTYIWGKGIHQSMYARFTLA